MDQKYDCFDRDKEPFYWFHVSPYCILWAVSELTIFSLVSYRAFLISHKQQKQRRFCRFVFLAALCATRMKFIASNMRFHTTSWQCTVSVPAEFHITGIKQLQQTLSFISRRIKSETKRERQQKTNLCDWNIWYMLFWCLSLLELL